MSISLISHLPEETALQLRKFEINSLRNWSWEFLRNCFLDDLDLDPEKRHPELSDLLSTARKFNKGVNSKHFYPCEHLSDYEYITGSEMDYRENNTIQNNNRKECPVRIDGLHSKFLFQRP